MFWVLGLGRPQWAWPKPNPILFKNSLREQAKNENKSPIEIANNLWDQETYLVANRQVCRGYPTSVMKDVSGQFIRVREKLTFWASFLGLKKPKTTQFIIKAHRPKQNKKKSIKAPTYTNIIWSNSIFREARYIPPNPLLLLEYLIVSHALFISTKCYIKVCFEHAFHD